MRRITVKKVTTRHELKDFVKLPGKVYAGNPCYVPDLEQDVRDACSPRKNTGMEYADVQPFIAYDENHAPVGRIMGIINHRANEKWHTKNARFGFIEFIDDADVSAALLQAVEQWGREHGMECVQGPMGVFDYDKEGMLVEDFDRMGSMVTIYNPPYYPSHLEALGYRKEVDWVQARVEIPKEVPAKYARVARLTKEMFGLKVKKLSQKDIDNGYGQKILHLMNAAYAPLFGYAELSDHQIDAFLQRYLPLLDLELVPVVEDAEGRLVGATVTMCSLSEALRKSGGRMFPFGWFHLLRALKWKREDKVELLLVGVHPDYQGLGVNALFFDYLIPVYNRYGFRWAETGPQLEENVRELSQWKPLHPQFVKRRRCYKKEL